MQLSPGKSGGKSIDACKRPRGQPRGIRQRSTVTTCLSSIAERRRRLRGRGATLLGSCYRISLVRASGAPQTGTSCARILRIPPATVAVSSSSSAPLNGFPGTPWLARGYDDQWPKHRSKRRGERGRTPHSPPQLRVPAARRRRRHRLGRARAAARGARGDRRRRDLPSRRCAR